MKKICNFILKFFIIVSILPIFADEYIIQHFRKYTIKIPSWWKEEDPVPESWKDHIKHNSLNKKVLTAYLSLGPLKTLEHSRRLIKNYLKYWDKYLQFNYIIELVEEKRKKIGSISLWNVNWRHLRAEIGVWLIPSYWNKGYGKRALKRSVTTSFNSLPPLVRSSCSFFSSL